MRITSAYDRVAVWHIESMPTYYHYTNDPDFHLDPHRHPNVTHPDVGNPPKGSGLFVSKDPTAWEGLDYPDMRKYRAELESAEDFQVDEDNPYEILIPSEKFPQVKVKKVQPWKGTP